MHDTAKYLIHVRIVADGIVERSDVVGAVFGQTEGLLGEELDLRDLQQSSKVGRIDVQIDSERGQSFGELTIATSLDKVETAILAAALETITRVGPCRAELEVTEIEDVRAAKRRQVVERAKELLASGFDETILSSEELREEVRRSVRVADVTEYEGLPAGPRVVDSDAIVVVEGRSDVLQLLKFGIKNAIAVEGTNVPDAIGELTADRTVTAFLDGDRGGELILKELTQVADVDYVAFAPPGTAVEDLDRAEAMSALREKVPLEMLDDIEAPRGITEDEQFEAVAGASDAEPPEEAADGEQDSVSPTPPIESASPDDSDPDAVAGDEAARTTEETAETPEEAPEPTVSGEEDSEHPEESGTERPSEAAQPPTTVGDHVIEIAGSATDRVRFLNDDLEPIDETELDAAGATLESMEATPSTIVVGGTLTQRLLDLAAQRGTDRIVAMDTGQFVKQPASPRVLAADQFVETPPEAAN